MQLYPHILLRTQAAKSTAATALRCAGYVVTKVRSDEDTERLVAALHVDAIVVDLPLTQVVPLMRRSRLLEVPMLLLGSVPESDLVSAVDLLIADRQKSQRYTFAHAS
jgi:DNA-binding response OmpR family regulator